MILIIAGVSVSMCVGFFILRIIFDVVAYNTYSPIDDIAERLHVGMGVLSVIMLVTAILMVLLHLIMTFMSIATIIGLVILVASPIAYLIGKNVRGE